MVNIYRKGILYYVKDDDIYIIEYLLKYKVKNNKIYFKNINKVIYILNRNYINYKINKLFNRTIM